MPFKGFAHNFMPHMVYSMKFTMLKWVQGQFWEDMFNYEWHPLKEDIDVFGILWVIHGYGAILRV
jgi:hypothetical protein